MRLRVNFGLIESKEVSWYQPLSSFPNIINYLGRNYEWVTYDTDPLKKIDYILTFSELPNYGPNYGILCTTWSEMFKDEIGGCECGAAHTSFPNGHMFFCRLWRKQ